jgi:hypothetical protein
VYSTPPTTYPPPIDHAVLLYDIQENVDGDAEYVIKNSWGDSAPHAFFRVKVGSNGLGVEENPVGIIALHEDASVV